MSDKIKKGLVIVYYGEGEGKTSAALGRAMRALGRGWRVAVVQFMKGRKTGEYLFLKKLGVEIYLTGPKFFLIKKKDLPLHLKLAKNGLKIALKIIKEKKVKLLILDEILWALKYRLFAEKEIVEIIKNRGSVHLILTGGILPPSLKKYADLVTEFKEVKHPLKKIGTIPGLDY